MTRKTALQVVVLAVVVMAAVAVGAPGAGAAAGDEAGGGRSIAGAGAYHPIAPQRILDSRRTDLGPSGAWQPTQARDLTVVGAAGIPAEATAVVLNVTVTGGTAASDLRLWPTGQPTPRVSNLNWRTGETVANLVTVAVGDAGRVSIRNQAGTVHVLADAVGWFGPGSDPTGSLHTPVTPRRILDSRAPNLGLAGPWTAAQTRILDLQGVAGLPADATAVVLNLTVTGGTAASDLRVWPGDGATPTTSNLNWTAGQTRPNLAIVPVDQSRDIKIRNQSGEVHVLADLVGYFSPSGDALTGITPRRIQDSRTTGTGLAGPWGPQTVRELTVAGVGDVPAGASAVVVNVTATGGTAGSDLRLWAAGEPAPPTSNLNWAAGSTVANLAVVEIGATGKIAIRNQAGEVHVLVDVVGYLAPRAGGATPLGGVAEISTASATCTRMEDATVRCWGHNGAGAVATGTLTNRLSPVPIAGLADVAEVSAGYAATCARLTDGTARCWGSNDDGQVGDGTTTDRPAPTPVLGLTDVAEISAGSRHVCARLTDGTARCWGSNTDGQLGDGTTTDRHVPTAVAGLTDVAEISAGADHTCARLTDGTARCWGSNDDGQVGDGTTADRHLPTAVAGLGDLAQIDAGVSTTCALGDTGTVSCWGWGYDEFGSPDPVTTPSAVPGLGGVEQISTGWFTSCALGSDSSVRCWTGPRDPQPTLVAGLDQPVAIDVGSAHGCAVEVDGTARCWGENENGQLGDGTLVRRAVAAPVLDLPADTVAPATPSGLVAVPGNQRVELRWDAVTSPDLAGYDIYRSTDAGVSWTKRNTAPHHETRWQETGLTNGTATHWRVVARDHDDNTSAPSAVVVATPSAPPLTGVAAVDAGQSHSCAAMADGTVRCWGANNRGQLGDATLTNRSTPVPVSGLTGVISVGAGNSFSCALLGTGGVRCWGSNSFGTLGDGTTFPRLTPVTVSGITTAVALSVGDNHSCARLADGTARCWGWNPQGGLGDGTTTTRTTPVAVAGLTGILEIQAGGGHTCARLGDGTTRCWGRNDSGQLGDGTTTSSATPVAVAGLGDTAGLALASGRSCARRSDGTVACWGHATGTGGTSVTLLSPTAVDGLADVVDLSTGYSHSCAVRTDGHVACWGSDANGELGDGPPAAAQLVPVEAVGIGTATQVSSGLGHVCARLGDGTARCWGAGTALGNGDLGSTSVPTPVVLPPS